MPYQISRPIILTAALLGLAGCGGGGGDGATNFFNVDLSQLPTFTLPGTAGDLAAYSGGFVATFNPTRLAAVRNTTAFVQNRINVIATNGATILAKPYLVSRLDYVRSIDANSDNQPDLTGRNVVLGIIDSAILQSHEQFSDVTTSSGLAPKFLPGSDVSAVASPTGDSHGTFVASIMAGNGGGSCIGAGALCNTALGYAPDARLYAGSIDYNGALDYADLASIVQGADAAGAVAINNSWTVSSGGAPLTVANSNPTAITGIAGGTAFLNALQAYATGGATGGVVVFAQSNTRSQSSASLLAGLPAEIPALEAGWLAVINVLADFDETNDRILRVDRRSAACLEAARWCIGATGILTGAGIANTTDYEIGQGTSFATPQVTGALGLLAQAFPTLTPAQLRNRLLVTADNSFFAPTHVLEVAPGIKHGYNSEFGHGLLNVRAALMPIGVTSAVSAQGEVLTIPELTMSGGVLAGDALAAGLGGVEIGFRDQLQAEFASPMATMVAVAAPASLPRLGLAQWAQGGDDLTLAALDAASVNGLARVDLLGDGGPIRLTALTGGDTAAGLALGATVPMGTGTVSAEISALRDQDGLFGMDLGGGSAAMGSVSAKVALAQPIGAGMELAIAAEVGRIEAQATGLVTALNGMAYNSASAALVQRSVLRRGDRLSLFVQTPLAAVSGQVQMAVPVPRTSLAAAAAAAAEPAAAFDTISVSVTPAARQFDLGFEYLMPLSDQSDMVLAYALQSNAGNIAGREDQLALLGWRMRF
jgi:subtilase-type serine protease